ncbi:MAG: AbrB family transcriptional regulator [Comamonadaceae bacterium CG_4_9_14_3_um_filter_60_33]|nr:MAG: AbrB family transcriptional regulator [Comamonadaceae bacterium CG2_30_59_20]PIY27560.1 MAG: AbrB family transcriptional regulator [Comamonadaceae bacterium CG_4_10_14_3_um_filter_60_42]PJB40708.1 MAG: AbrB family transcriptional regulator [Comamonadaceae bacterium CG_4_9_14_3_um_filter_60_33]
MTMTAKLFMSGRSQAIRLPAKLRLQAQEVRIEQIGKALWVQPESAANNNMGQWLEDFYASTDALPADFLADRHDTPPQERDWT